MSGRGSQSIEEARVKRLVVVGAGISGLAAAHAAAMADAASGALEIIVLERDAEVGGKAQTLREDGWQLEAGPAGYLGPDPAVDRLVQDVGISGASQPAEQAAARRFIVRGRRMREISTNPMRFLGSGILGPAGILRIAAEPFIAPRESTADESVWDFAARRIGPQAADRLIAPMVLGVFAGDAHQLSLRAAFPRLAGLEREHGSLIRGMVARMRAHRKGGGPSGPAGWLTSFRDGMQALPRAVAANGRFQVRCRTAVRSLARGIASGWRLDVDGIATPLDADAVVLAGEPWAMAEIVREVAPELALQLDTVQCPPVTVVGMGFKSADVADCPRGFGVLIPRGESYRILGSLWDSHIFPGRSPAGHLLVRVMVGGSVDPEAALLPDGQLLDMVYDELRRLLGVRARPVYERIVRWPRAIPQYELGHLERVGAIERELDRLPGVYMAGNALDGISFGRATTRGLTVGESAALWLLQAEPDDAGEIA